MFDVDTLPRDVQAELAGKDVIVFDGECVLCSRFFQFILRHDRDKRFQFVIAQSDLGTRLYKALNLSPTEFETNLIIVDGQIYTRLDSLAAALGALGAPWSVLRFLRWLPDRVKSPIYRVIAHNRYRIFGRFDTCMVPDADVSARFLGPMLGKAVQ